MQKLWYCQISRNQTVLGHGDTMIHKHSANLFLPEQAPMGCTSYGPRSHQAAEQVLSQTAERAWAQPQARACSAFWLEPIGSQHKLSCPSPMPEELLPGCLQGAPVLPRVSCNIRIHPFAGLRERRWGGLARQASTNS